MTTTPPGSDEPTSNPTPAPADVPPASHLPGDTAGSPTEPQQPAGPATPTPAPASGAPDAPAYAAPAPGYAAAPPVPPAAGGPVPPYQPYQAPAPSSGTTNVLAIVSFVGSFFISLVGIICGHIALGQIKRTGEKGRGFALAGLIIGYVSIALTIVGVTILIIVSVMSGLAVATAVRNLPTAIPSAPSDDIALTVDCARFTAAADSLLPVVNEQLPNLADDPETAKAALVSAFDAFTLATSSLSDPDLSSEVDAFNADIDTFKADLDAYIATPADQRDSTQLEDDVNTLSDQFDTLNSYCG
ncbi:DUF4190 domain-containing protein [Leifsonia sp. ZF2019]|uniref:DUF4190 domain-containing protein n=1 Tax=Leifsonia sp. ZF2019 TaxID=2781978 RepID=UPI001CBBB1E0|nr:DUF4190 domain-containing protein [Leifsonia sp. ZF2019]